MSAVGDFASVLEGGGREDWAANGAAEGGLATVAACAGRMLRQVSSRNSRVRSRAPSCATCVITLAA